MGALSGSMAVRRYRVLGTPPQNFREHYEKTIRAHALVPLDPAKNMREEKSVGWCSLHDEEDLELEFGKFFLGGEGGDRILLSLRTDVLKPPAGQVKALLKQRQREVEAQRQAPMSAGALRELKELIVLELRQKTPPKIRTINMVWLLEAQRLYFFSHSKGPNETFMTLFAQTFNLPIDLEGPGFWAGQYAAAEQLDQELKRTKPTVELLSGFIGLRPGTREVDDFERLDRAMESAAHAE